MHNNRIGNQMKNLFARFLKDESGATAIEYGLIAALISVGIIAGAGSLGNSINSTFDKLGTKMDGAAPAAP
jgi:pilus assembly protein Flp/PilA